MCVSGDRVTAPQKVTDVSAHAVVGILAQVTSTSKVKVVCVCVLILCVCVYCLVHVLCSPVCVLSGLCNGFIDCVNYSCIWWRCGLGDGFVFVFFSSPGLSEWDADLTVLSIYRTKQCFVHLWNKAKHKSQVVRQRWLCLVFSVWIYTLVVCVMVWSCFCHDFATKKERTGWNTVCSAQARVLSVRWFLSFIHFFIFIH